jgi:hypothetical protein
MAIIIPRKTKPSLVGGGVQNQAGLFGINLKRKRVWASYYESHLVN